MSIEWVLYLIDVVGKVPGLFIAAAATLAMVSIICLIVHHDKDSEVLYRPPLYIKVSFSLGAIFFFIGAISFVAIPSEKTMYAIAFAHYSKQSEIPAKVLKAIDVKLDEVIEGVKK
jgi:hypothetical protein